MQSSSTPRPLLRSYSSPPANPSSPTNPAVYLSSSLSFSWPCSPNTTAAGFRLHVRRRIKNHSHQTHTVTQKHTHRNTVHRLPPSPSISDCHQTLGLSSTTTSVLSLSLYPYLSNSCCSGFPARHTNAITAVVLPLSNHHENNITPSSFAPVTRLNPQPSHRRWFNLHRQSSITAASFFFSLFFSFFRPSACVSLALPLSACFS